MASKPLLPIADYQRIYLVLYSVLQASEIAITHRACFFFASVGAVILREAYGWPATISAGCMALMIDKARADVVVYGRQEESGEFVVDQDGFHAWVECRGWLIDFMSPILGDALQEDGRTTAVPRRMLQKRLSDAKASLGAIQHVGDFFVRHDKGLAESLVDSQPIQFHDLMHVCRSWYVRPPKPLKPMLMGDSHGPAKMLVARAPVIQDVW